MRYDHRDLGQRYASDGLYGLIKLRRYAEEYEQAVYELAKRIVSVAGSVRIGTGRPVDHRLAPSAFGSPGVEVGTSRPMRITIAAPTRHDLPEGRSPEYYGDSPQDWNPYHPNAGRPLARTAEDLVRSLNYQPSIASFGEGRHDAKALPSTPEILLVDRWALMNEDHRRRLAAFDAENRPWVTVVVPWNRADHQSRAAEVGLTEMVEATMPATLRRGRASLHSAAKGVPTMEAFEQILPQVAEVAAQQFLRHAPAAPPAEDRRSRTFVLRERDTP